MEVAAGRTGGGPLRRFVSRGPKSTLILYVVALLLACTCVVGGVLSYRTYEDRKDEKAEQERYGEVISAASTVAEAIANIDYRDPEATFDTVAEHATGEFRDTYASVTSDLVEVLVQNKSVQEGKVVKAAVSSLDKDSARVLVVTEGTVINNLIRERQGNNPTAVVYRMAFELVHEDGEWLASELEFG